MIGGVPLFEGDIDLLGGMGDGFWPVHLDQAIGGPINLQLQQPLNLVIRVSDTGNGIPEEDLERVMEPFGQARQHSEIAQEGVGLGLHLVKNFAEMHGGKLTLQSQVGKGTTAIVALPRSLALRSVA